MLIVDTALKRCAAENKPIRVGLVGAGNIAMSTAIQIANYTPGMRLAAIANRTPAKARAIWAEIGSMEAFETTQQNALEDAIRAERPVVTEDYTLLCQSEGVDVILELTGNIPFGTEVALAAIAGGKHFVTMSAEMDSTVGPILRKKANDAGVVYTLAEGDQPGVQMNLYRWVETLGLTPLVCGNIKGMIDQYRTPETQAGFAAEWNQSVDMVTSFADGTKVAMEQACVANATGMCVAKRGMSGPEHRGHIDGLLDFYNIDTLRAQGGVVDYALASDPSPGVYVFAAHDNQRIRDTMFYAKMGKGPLYSFYIPYHLFNIEAPISVARAALFHDTVLATDGPIRVEVATIAKRDLKAGDMLDGVGGFHTYGECENVWISRAENLLPMGLSEGCRLIRDVPKDQALSYADVKIPEGRLLDTLRVEQDALFPAPER